MALEGRLSVVAVSAAGTTFATIDDLNSCQMQLGGTSHDVTKFGDTFVRRLQGLSDASYNLAGFFDQADTSGQTIITTAKIARSLIWIMFKPDGSAGWKQQVSVENVNINSTATGIQEFSVTLQAAEGTITTV
jgi:hypothetical protein